MTLSKNNAVLGRDVKEHSEDRGAGSQQVLAVDLDGTLIATDLLLESFWGACLKDWRTPLHAASALRQGRAALKRLLARRGDIDVAQLPYNQAVLDRVAAWRETGGRTVLVTASDHAFAERVAAHLGIFDAVHGSDGENNLKGERKAAFLAGRFGERGFAYIGDHPADLPVWRRASRALTLTPSASLRAKVDAINIPAEHLPARHAGLLDYLRAIRLHQWVKNILVFLPIIAAHRLDTGSILLSVLAFIAFGLTASAMYLLNDLLDLPADRAHPRKRHRPVPAGVVPILHASLLAPLLAAAGGALALVIGGAFALVIVFYAVVTVAYSFALKRVPILDIAVLAGLYTLRIVAGGLATGTPLSVWLLAFSLFFFFALAAVKRHSELVNTEGRRRGRVEGRGYEYDDLPLVPMMALSSGFVSVLVLALYIDSAAVRQLYGEPALLWGVCPVLQFWIARMVLITHRSGMTDDPIVFALKDRASHVCGAIVGACALLATLG
jgi:4-hydroxybenzoate polyprenyltransferase/phosphoserine phosphatase